VARVVRRVLLLLVLAVVAASTVLFVWAPFADDRPDRVDAIVVLAGSKSRLPLALKLFREGVAPTLAISRDPDEAARRRLCRLPPSHAFCFRADPYSTRGEMRAVAEFARQRHWRSVAIVSSRFHLFRIRLLARRCTDVRLELVPAHVTWWAWPQSIASEWAKLAVAETTRRGC
jgi:uncharacterized SAM-binding protein YcdF (DUF218 family)